MTSTSTDYFFRLYCTKFKNSSPARFLGGAAGPLVKKGDDFMYDTIVPHNLARRKKEFSTVVPMIATIEQRTTRPQIIVCPECNGTRRLEYVDPDTLQIKNMPCVFCDSTGHFTRNASHQEHQSLVKRLAGWTWNAVKAVML